QNTLKRVRGKLSVTVETSLPSVRMRKGNSSFAGPSVLIWVVWSIGIILKSHGIAPVMGAASPIKEKSSKVRPLRTLSKTCEKILDELRVLHDLNEMFP